MKAYQLLIFAALFAMNCRVGAQGFVWTSQISMTGGPTGDKVAVDSSADVYVTGGFQGPAKFGSTNLANIGNEDIFLAKYDSTGKLIWVEQAGGTNSNDAGQDVCVDTNGNVYIVGDFQGHTRFENTTLTAAGSEGDGAVNNQFIAKYNSAGTLVWVQQAEGPGGGAAMGVAVDNAGFVYTTGENQNYDGWESITVDKWNSSGNLVWDREFAQLPNYNGVWQQGNSIKVDTNGNVYVTGEFQTTVTFGSTILSTVDNFGSGIFILKLDSAGNVLWAEQGNSPASPNNVANSIALDGSGNVIFAGNYNGPTSFGTNILTTQNSEAVAGFVVKCDRNGNFLWAQQATTYHGGNCNGLSVDAAGNIYVTGSTAFSQSFLEKYDPNGNLVWALEPGNSSYAGGYGTAVDASNHIYVVVWTAGNISFDNFSFTNVGGNDIFVSQASEKIPPVFLTQPQNSPAGFAPGGTYTFNTSTRSIYPVSYQWQFNGTNIGGATNSSLTVANVQLVNQGGFDVVASNFYGSTTSLVANLTVYFTVTLIINGNASASISPVGISSYPGNSVVTFIAATNVTDPFIGWSGDISGTNYTISTLITTNLYVTASFADSITNIIIDNVDRRANFSGAWFSASFYGRYGADSDYAVSSNVPSSTAVYRPNITVPGYYDVFVWYPEFGNYYDFSTNAPWSVVCASGSVVTNVDEATGGGNWNLIAPGMTFAAGTNGYVSLSNDTGESSPTFVVADAVRFFPSQPPTITMNPLSLTAKTGGTATFTVSVSGTEPFNYQWLFNNLTLTNAHGSALAITNVEPSNVGYYSVIVSNFLGTTCSSNAFLVVTPPSSPSLGSASINHNGQFQMILTGDSNVLFSIGSSTNLTDWIILTNLLNTTGSAIFIDTLNTNDTDTARFYRAQWLPQ